MRPLIAACRLGGGAHDPGDNSGLGQRGAGVAEVDGQRVYVPFTLPGEVVEIEAEGERGTLLSVIEASPDRIAPFCGYFGICGGCTLQHVGARRLCRLQARAGRKRR